MTLLLVMLHLGTMFAVIVYFWRSWRQSYFASRLAFQTNGLQVALATVVTGVVGLALLQVIKHLVAGNAPGFEIEQLFGNTRSIAAALAAAGVLILVSARSAHTASGELSLRSAAWIVPRVFALWRNDLQWAAARRQPATRGGVQLCIGSRADPGGHRQGGLPLHAGMPPPAPASQCGTCWGRAWWAWV